MKTPLLLPLAMVAAAACATTSAHAQADCSIIGEAFSNSTSEALVLTGRGVSTASPDTNARAALKDGGDLTGKAYPLGAILLRPLSRSDGSERETSDASLSMLLAHLQIASAGGPCSRVLLGALSTGEDYLRLPVALDPVARRRHPERDVSLSAGDVLYLPDRPPNVLVIGAVGAPGAVTFRSGFDARSYIKQAGGWTSGARKGDVRVYLPDGAFRQLSVAFWNYERRNIPPGSIVIVPQRGESVEQAARKLLASDHSVSIRGSDNRFRSGEAAAQSKRRSAPRSASGNVLGAREAAAVADPG